MSELTNSQIFMIADNERVDRSRYCGSLLHRINSFGLRLSTSVKFATATAVIIILLLGFRVWQLSNMIQGESSEDSHVPGASMKVSANYTCRSADCLKASSRIRKNLNPSVDPCVDFYEFACGGWMTTQKELIKRKNKTFETQFGLLGKELGLQFQEILERDNRPGDSQSLKDSKIFYKKCLNNKNGNRSQESQELRNFIKHLVIDIENSTELQSSKLGKTLGKIRREMGGNFQILTNPYVGGNYLFSIGLNIDFNDFQNGVKSPKYKIEVQPAVLSCDILGSTSKKIDVDLITTVWQGIYSYDDWITSDAARKIIALETKLAEISLPSSGTEAKADFFKLASIADLSRTSHNVLNWTELFQELYSGSSIPLNRNELQVSILKVYDLRNLHSVLEKFTMTDIRNYLKWRIILDLAFLSPSLGSVFHYKDILKFSEISPFTCVSRTKDYFTSAMTLPYIQTYFGDEIKDQVTGMVGYLKEAFDVLLIGNSWLEYSDIMEAKNKIEKMRLNLAYPKSIDHLTKNKPSTLEQEPGIHFTINASKSYLQNTLDGIKFQSLQELKKLGTTKTYERWRMSPLEVNAAYEPEFNTMTLPAAILQIPFHDNPLECLNFGAIGSIIGHEITHGFDSTGRAFDEDGVFNDWWTSWSSFRFNTKSSCFVAQYDKYKDPDCNLFVNGTLTLDENIADNGGVRQAFKAYQNYLRREGLEKALPGLNYNSNQLFFISYAQAFCEVNDEESCKSNILEDKHSPGRLRIKGSLHNFEEFHKIWNCPLPASTNERTCRVW